MGTSSTSPARTMSQPIMVSRRSHLSARAPASGPSNTFGTAVIANVIPTCSGPYCATRKASATWWTRSPNRLTSWPTHSSEKFALRAKRRYGDCARSRGGAPGRPGNATPGPAAGTASGGVPIGPAGAS